MKRQQYFITVYYKELAGLVRWQDLNELRVEIMKQAGREGIWRAEQ